MIGTRYEKHELSDNVVQARMKERIISFVEDCDSRNVPYAIYINETNGIQALPILEELSIPARFCYIRSTHFESKATGKAIASLPQDFLLSAALGEHILVIDYGARKDKSRAIYQGVPYAKYVLNRLWLDITPNKVWIESRSNTRGIRNECATVFDGWYSTLGANNKKKLLSYREIAQEHLDIDGVSIEGISEATIHDNDKFYYAQIKKEYFEYLERLLTQRKEN